MPFIANKSNLAQLTNIHYWNSAGAAWSGNLIGAATPFAFLPNPVIAGDLILFGIDSTVLDSGPFCSLVFDIGSVITDVTGITWRYSDASGADPTAPGWAPQPVQDNTDQDGLMTGVAFDTSGIRSVHWVPSPLWIVQNPTIGGVALGVTGLWICAHVTIAGGAGVPPTQNNRDIYTITWPSITIPQPGGDMEALFRVRIRGESNRAQSRWITGLRRTSRGADFRSFINIADEQNAPGVTVTSGLGFANDPVAPAGRKVTGVPAPGGTTMALVNWSSAAAPQYTGTYRLFLRANQLVAPNGTISFQIIQQMGPTPFFYTTWQSSVVTMISNGIYFEILDMGQVHIPGIDIIESYALTWSIEAFGNGVVGVDVIDLIIIPVDEWAADLYAQYLLNNQRSNSACLGMVTDIDNVRYPKRMPRALNYCYSGEVITSEPRFIGGKGGLIANVTQSLHSMTMTGDPTGWASYPEAAESVEFFQWIQRYSSMRGAG